MPRHQEWRGSVVHRAGRSRLYLKVRVDGRWVMRVTPYGPGQEREAEAMLAAMRDGLLARESEGLPSGLLTVRAWVSRWLEQRERDEIADAPNDRQRLEDHVLPVIGDLSLDEVRPRHLLEVVAALRTAGRAPRTVRNVYGSLRACWRDARIADLTANDPCILTHRQLGRIRDADPTWRDEAQLSHAELSRLLTAPEVPLERRVLWGLLSLAMLRHGEMAGLRWRAVQLEGDPLGRLEIGTSYDLGRTKGRKGRRVPIHPSLRPLLAEWRLSGWRERHRRPPEDGDLVLPRPRDPLGLRRHQSTYRRLELDLARLELRRRHPHGLRRTGISLALSAGADEARLRWVTHGRPGTIMGAYTTLEWARTCEQVTAIPPVRATGTTVVPLPGARRAPEARPGRTASAKSAKSRS